MEALTMAICNVVNSGKNNAYSNIIAMVIKDKAFSQKNLRMTWMMPLTSLQAILRLRRHMQQFWIRACALVTSRSASVSFRQRDTIEPGKIRKALYFL